MLKKEMQLQLKTYPTDQLDTIFVGGGTPTSLNEKQLVVLCEFIKNSCRSMKNQENIHLKRILAIFREKNLKSYQIMGKST